ncbi:MAG: hypothetical protein GY750_03910 [Lentisphaerae bacterium]|nr:hypothetical protein [Lentisphaerota bacterium]MCP4100559.1 hypothetical protein [Lentisphaerota bacterium]
MINSKKIFLMLISIVSFCFCASSFGQKCAVTISNQSNRPIYVYDFNYGTPASVQPVTKGNPLDKGKSLTLNFQPNPKMRIYFSDKPLAESLEKGQAPDPFNINVDGAVMYSFVEYNYEPGYSRYTFDLSYIDEYSYPVTVMFTNIGNYNGCQDGFEYGPQKMSAITTQLENQTDYKWNALIWPLTNVKTRWGQYPNGIYRVAGPNKVWAAETTDKYKIGPWVPSTYLDFILSLPKAGTKLFSTDTNWNGWQNWNASHTPSPSGTGYVKALHKAAIPDSKGKYGFFCYPNDNSTGEFTWIPSTVNCTVTVYPYDS